MTTLHPRYTSARASTFLQAIKHVSNCLLHNIMLHRASVILSLTPVAMPCCKRLHSCLSFAKMMASTMQFSVVAMCCRRLCVGRRLQTKSCWSISLCLLVCGLSVAACWWTRCLTTALSSPSGGSASTRMCSSLRRCAHRACLSDIP